MNIKFLFNNRNLQVNNRSLEFSYPIRDVKLLNNYVIVLLSIPTNDNTIDNLYAVDNNGKMVWRSQNMKEIYSNEQLLPYEQMIVDNQIIIASDFYARWYYINSVNGKILKRDITK